MDTPQPAFTAIVLAADRGPDDPVARAAGVPCKSLTPVDGTPMIFRVLGALAASREVGERILCGPPKAVLDQEPKLGDLIASGEVKWFENQATPSLSAYHVMQILPEKNPILLTTADHALLSAPIVDHFCSEARASGCDVVVAVALHEAVIAALPGTQRTATHLRDGAYCGCNLFAFLTPRSRVAANFWRQVENQRKKPLRVVKVLGWMAIFRYLLGRLTLAESLARISRRLGLKAGAVIMPFPKAAVDVDSVNDWRLVERIATNKEP